MAWFTVQYRDKNGAKAEAEFEAADKTALFKLLAEKKISAVNVSEGRLGKKGARKRTTGGTSPNLPKSLVRGIVAGVVVFAGAIIAWHFLARGGGSEKPDAAKNPPKTVKPAPMPVVPSPEKPEVAPPKPVEDELPPSQRRVKTISIQTNYIGQICERYQTADGKTHKIYRPSKPPLFKHQTDQLLAMALAGDDRRSAPPLPLGRNLDKEFLESLKTPIEISPDDPPDIVARKEAVIAARKQVDELMRQGIGFTQILADHQKLMSENKQIRDEMIREIKQYNAESDRESTQKALDSVNAALENMGITPIEMPKTAEERAAEREARQAARAQGK